MRSLNIHQTFPLYFLSDENPGKIRHHSVLFLKVQGTTVSGGRSFLSIGIEITCFKTLFYYSCKALLTSLKKSPMKAENNLISEEKYTIMPDTCSNN